MFDIEARILPPPDDTRRRALISDDDAVRRSELAAAMIRRGFAVLEAGAGFAALAMIGRHSPEVALIRFESHGDEGERAAAIAGIAYPTTRVILTADRGPVRSGPKGGANAVLDGSIDDGAVPVLFGPIDPCLLDRCLHDLLD